MLAVVAALFAVAIVALFTGNIAYANNTTDVTIDDTDSAWKYSGDGDANAGGWEAGGSTTPESTEHWSNTAGASVSISFEGTGFELYGIKAPNHRFISVQIDDGDIVEVDAYAPNRQSNQRLFQIKNLEQGSHVARVTVLDKSNPAASNALGVSLQYAVALGVSLDPNRDITSRIEVGTQTDGDDLFAWNFKGDWSYGNTHPELFSAGDEVYTDDPEASATIRFEGTRIVVGGSLNTAHDVYRFTLDGVDKGTFDAGDTTEKKHQQTLFDSGELENAEHILVIESDTKTGEKSVQLDYADVTHKPIKPTSIKLDTENFSLEAGKVKEIGYSLEPSIADPASVVWTSSDEAVATVEDGTVTAQSVEKSSKAVIKATVEGTDVAAEVEVTVVPAVKGFNAFVGDEKLLDLPDTAYEDATSDFTAEWSGTSWLGDARASKIGVATRDSQIDDVVVEVGDFHSESGATLSASNVEVRWLREVEADAGRGMTGKKVNYPDVIYYANDGIDIPAETLQFAWVTISVPQDAAPGTYTGTLTVKAGDIAYPLTYTLEVIGLKQPTAQETGYHVQLWQHPFSATGYYFGKSDIWGGQGGNGLWGATIGTDAPIDKFMDDDFKAYYRGILEDYAEMGGDDLVANIVDDAWGHQCYYSDTSMVTWTKTADGWKFDYTLFDQWVQFAIDCGVLDPSNGVGKIKCYSMIPWSDRITYIDESGEETYMEPTKLSAEWKDVWSAFLNDFMAHLDEKGWFDITYIAFDERPQIDGVCKFIKEQKNAEGKSLKTAAAINYAPDQVGQDQYLDDISVGQKHVLSSWNMDEWYAFVDERRAEGLETTMYTCTGDYPNSSQQADPGDIYWSALYSEALHTDGYLRWALDAWTNDMYGDTTFINWEPGDPWFIYPLELGEDGTYDPSKLAENPKGFYSSPRYEMFKQGIRDVCKARYLKKLGGDVNTEVTALMDSMQFPNGSNNVPASQADRMLAHSESARMIDGISAIARKVATEVPTPEPDPVDKSALQSVVADARALNGSDYTDETWAVFCDALSEAERVAADDAATQEQVDAAIASLNSAIAQLVKVDVAPGPDDKDDSADKDDPADKDDSADKPQGGEKPKGSGDEGIPATGDPASLIGFVALAGAAITGVGIASRRR